jgi:two-component system, OmpR family, response regulator
MKSAPQVMLVEDDESLGFLIKDSLDSLGWKVHLYPDGEKGLSGFHSNTFDLCILDVMLPHKDGYDLATNIRRYNQQVPIVFLTAKSRTEDKIRGFQTGADDYVCKPFSLEEFKYRLQAVLKRASDKEPAGSYSGLLKAGTTTLDIHNLALTVHGVVISLTYKEAKLLEIFFRHPDKVIEREIFLKSVWEEDGFFVARSMDVFISRVRKYLSGDGALKIDNIRGIGYRMKCLGV